MEALRDRFRLGPKQFGFPERKIVYPGLCEEEKFLESGVFPERILWVSSRRWVRKQGFFEP